MVLNNILVFLFSPEHGVGLYGTCHQLLPLWGGKYLTAEQLWYHLNLVLKYLSSIPVILLFVLEYLVSVTAFHSVKLRLALFGKPSIIIEDGRIIQREMKRNRFTPEELLQELRNQGVEDLSTVARAVLETSGQLNVILRAEHRPVTAQTLNLTVPDAGRFTAIISDGRVLSTNLQRMGRDSRWLDHELARHGTERSEDVYLLLLNESGQVYFAARENA